MLKQNIVQNVKYKIKTPTGWSNFSGIKRNQEKNIVTITTSTGKILRCTINHRIKTSDNIFKCVSELSIGDTIISTNGVDIISEIRIISDDPEYVYDALEVENGNEYYTNDILSHNCSFVGSQNTLISGSKLKELSFSIPIAESEGIKQYKQPKPESSYVLIADVSRGKGLDYSTFSILDISKMPYEQVCTFRDNYVSTIDYANIIFRLAKMYNNAQVMVEINDIGGQVADTLYFEYGYEEMLFTENSGRSGKRVSGGFGKSVDRGIRTTKTVKSIGCSILKMLIEQNQLLINDFDTIQELARFSRRGASYEAESGAHDDMVMTLVLFSWLTDQNFFKDITDINTLMKLREKTDEQMDEDLLPFGFIDDGRESDSYF
jgi:hypothetical protein